MSEQEVLIRDMSRLLCDLAGVLPSLQTASFPGDVAVCRNRAYLDARRLEALDLVVRASKLLPAPAYG